MNYESECMSLLTSDDGMMVGRLAGWLCKGPALRAVTPIKGLAAAMICHAKADRDAAMKCKTDDRVECLHPIMQNQNYCTPNYA